MNHKKLWTIVKRGEKALQELELSLVTKADKKRHAQAYQALSSLDEDRAYLLYAIEMLVFEMEEEPKRDWVRWRLKAILKGQYDG